VNTPTSPYGLVGGVGRGREPANTPTSPYGLVGGVGRGRGPANTPTRPYGLVGGVRKGNAPPSRILSEGGVWWSVVGSGIDKVPLRLAFRAREGCG
jgi:hypothetical protein